MKVGTRLKKLRRRLGLTQKGMMGDLMTNRWHYSRIENEQISIRADEVLQLLRLHNEPVVKFLEDEDQVNLHEQRQDQVIQAYFERDVEKLKQLKSSEELNNQHDKLAIEMLVAKLEGKDDKFTPALKRKMKHVFFEMKNFNKNILWLLLVYMNLYKLDELESLMNVIFNRYEKAKNLDRRTQELMASICVSYLKICSREDENSFEVVRIEQVLESIPDFVNVFLQKLIGQYFIFKRRGQVEWAKFVKDLIKKCGYLNYLEM